MMPEAINPHERYPGVIARFNPITNWGFIRVKTDLKTALKLEAGCDLFLHRRGIRHRQDVFHGDRVTFTLREICGRICAHDLVVTASANRPEPLHAD